MTLNTVLDLTVSAGGVWLICCCVFAYSLSIYCVFYTHLRSCVPFEYEKMISTNVFPWNCLLDTKAAQLDTACKFTTVSLLEPNYHCSHS